VGHFESQGVHSSGLSYVDLMRIHHTGGNPSGQVPLPPRPVLDLLVFNNERLEDPKFKLAFERWKKRTYGESSNAILLEDIGKILRDKEKAIFGSNKLAPNKVPPKDVNNPLIDSGELRNKTALKTSINNIVKEG